MPYRDADWASGDVVLKNEERENSERILRGRGGFKLQIFCKIQREISRTGNLQKESWRFPRDSSYGRVHIKGLASEHDGLELKSTTQLQFYHALIHHLWAIAQCVLRTRELRSQRHNAACRNLRNQCLLSHRILLHNPCLWVDISFIYL